MVNLNIIPKGGKFDVIDSKERVIYRIKQGMNGKIHLLDSSGYKLYYITYDKKQKKPSFKMFLNDKEILTAECTSMFLEPGFELRGDNIFLDVRSNDRREFKIMDGENQIGAVFSETEKKDFRYIIEISENSFDDYIPLIAVCIDIAFGKMNRG